MAADEKSMPFLKHLASSDRKTRTAALSTLRTFLSASTTSRTLTPLENLKLWKGLFYALYMADRPIPQQNLCTSLAELLEILPDEAVAPWLVGFWDVMAREWAGIDVLRMEKFLLLVRRVLGKSLGWVREGKRKERGETMLAVLAEWPFEETGDLKRVPAGLRLHVLDIWVDEAEKVGMLGEGPEAELAEADMLFLEGVRGLLKVMVLKTVKPVKTKARESLEDERLPWNQGKKGSGSEEDDDEMTDAGGEEEDGWGGFDD